MKTVIFLALLATVHASWPQYIRLGANSQTFQQLVDIENIVIQTTLNGLLFFEERISQDSKVQLEKIKTNASNYINNTINEAFKTINRSIHNGKEEGKNVDTYYRYVKDNLEWKRRNAFVEMATCIQKWTIVEEALADVITQIQATKKLVSLNAIPNCNSTNFLRKQECVIENIGKFRYVVERNIEKSGKMLYAVSGKYMMMLIYIKGCIEKMAAETNTYSNINIKYINNMMRNPME